MNKLELYHHYRQGGLTLEEASLAVEYMPDAEIYDDPNMTLMCAFLFSETPEGHDFWYEIAERIEIK